MISLVFALSMRAARSIGCPCRTERIKKTKRKEPHTGKYAERILSRRISKPQYPVTEHRNYRTGPRVCLSRLDPWQVLWIYPFTNWTPVFPTHWPIPLTFSCLEAFSYFISDQHHFINNDKLISLSGPCPFITSANFWAPVSSLAHESSIVPPKFPERDENNSPYITHDLWNHVSQNGIDQLDKQCINTT